MKHIDKYNKFIKLNEDIEIDGDIDEYDLNIIKDALVELEDLGMNITNIVHGNNICSIELCFNSNGFSQYIYYICDIGKNKFYNEEVHIEYSGKLFEHELNDYENIIISNIKERSQFLLNILDYYKCHVILDYDAGGPTSEYPNEIFIISINLSKIKLKE